MEFGSVCSGIEAASVAWLPLGWHAAWLSEIDVAAARVLAHRFPGTPNHGDMTKLPDMVRAGEIPAPGLLVGGTPCQGFSVAGMRGGMGDHRSNLAFSYVDLADAIDEQRPGDPCIAVWENVPGCLSMPDNSFGHFLAALVGDDQPLEPGPRPEPGRSTAHWAWETKAGVHRPKWPVAGYVVGPSRAAAWRVQDAQYHGLAQRRRRVFVVASAREGFDPAAVLLEFDGVRRDSAPRREAGESTAYPTPASTGDGCDAGAGSGGSDRVAPVPTWWDGRDVSQTLDAVLHKGQTMPEKNRFPAVLQPVAFVQNQRDELRTLEVAGALAAQPGMKQQTYIAFSTKDHGQNAAEDLSPTLRAMQGQHPNAGGQVGVAYAVTLRGRDGGGTAELGDDLATCLRASGGGGDKPHVLCVTGDITHTLKAEGFDAIEDGTGRGQPIVNVLPFDTTQITSASNYSKPEVGDPCHPLAAGAHPPAVAINGRMDPCYYGEKTGALDTDQGTQVVFHEMAVRRLMPVECERLQGFPDGWTDVPGKNGKPAADGPRYKQLGNSMAVTCMAWIGRRIQQQLRHNGGPVLDDYEELIG